jgi:hypothetical protein
VKGRLPRPVRSSKRSAKDWRLDVKDAERPVDVDAFLRRMVDVLLDVERYQPESNAGRQPDADPPQD